MQLKAYQSRILDELSVYLSALKEQRDKFNGYKTSDAPDVRELAADYDFPKKAWIECGMASHHTTEDGTGAFVPDIYLKVPTGGGKTLLAVHSIDAIRQKYLSRVCGITLWIVPSDQIYRQTLRQLKDRHHPYRQALDIASGGRTLIRERHQLFTPNDCASRHVILLLMLPATNREDKEQLRMFKDRGGFEAFFPPEDDPIAHEALLQETPNLDRFGDENDLLPTQLKTSLGNVLRLHRPLIVVDEGQKAYSGLARRTLGDFNPSFMLELSATPPQECNVLTQATGRELDREEMIKLDINLTNQVTPDWKQTLLTAHAKRVELEKAAGKLEQESGRHIRPIMLVQVERTGADQQGGKQVHSEDARKYLIEQCDISPHEIVVKSSDKNELGDIDLLSPECAVRYIITKQALQEGWDCAFAYVLAVLSNLSAQTSLTQLAGRILRQPDARKTGITALDECYIYTNREDSGKMAGMIKRELEKEGLGDLGGCIRQRGGGGGDNAGGAETGHRTAKIAPKFQRFAGKVYLPQFVVMDGRRPRPLDYDGDILAHLDWQNLYAPDMDTLELQDTREGVRQMRIGLAKDSAGGDEMEVLEKDDFYFGLGIDSLLMTRQLQEVVPNPWHAHEKTLKILNAISAQEEKNGTRSGITPQTRMELNFIYIIDEAKKRLGAARDEMARQYFMRQVDDGKIKLILFTADSDHDNQFRIPPQVKIRSHKQMNRDDGGMLQKSLFDYVPNEDLNGLERCVALYLDDHERLLWWYRNQVYSGYAIQGWKRGQIYPDLIAATAAAGEQPNISEVLVMETKGRHLKGNDDTEYKRTLLEMCSDLCATAANGKPKLCKWEDLAKDFQNHTFRFQLVNEESWKDAINNLLKR